MINVPVDLKLFTHFLDVGAKGKLGKLLGDPLFGETMSPVVGKVESSFGGEVEGTPWWSRMAREVMRRRFAHQRDIHRQSVFLLAVRFSEGWCQGGGHGGGCGRALYEG